MADKRLLVAVAGFVVGWAASANGVSAATLLDDLMNTILGPLGGLV
jgi:hypothetical protein